MRYPLCHKYALFSLILTLSTLISLPEKALAVTVVTVVHPEQSIMMQEVRLSGSLKARQEASISVRVDGLVQKVNFEEGDPVKKGETLLELDPKLELIAQQRARAVRMDAEARLREAQRLQKEAEQLIDKRHISQTELEARKSNVTFAEAALVEARASEKSQAEVVARHKVPAPFDGFVVSKHAEAGEWITRGTAVFDLVNPSEVWLDVQAPQEFYALTVNAAEVFIYPDSQPGAEIPGKILTQVPASNNEARTYLLRLIPLVKSQLLPGTSASALIRIPSSKEALMIPQDALARQPDGQYNVFTVIPSDQNNSQQATAHRQHVQPGLRINGQVEIISGLRPDMLVVTRGNEILREGDPVIINQQPTATERQ